MKTNTTAANEAAKNTAIYNELADIARRVFNQINGTEEGKKYTPADIARAITGGPVVSCLNGLNYRFDGVEPYQLGGGFSWADGFDPETAYDVAVDGFSCRVIAWKIFDVLDRAARSLDIPTAARVTFERPRAAAPVVASFTLSTAAARELAACCANDEMRPVMNGVQLDTRRRVLVASDGHVLRVVTLGAALTVDESAAALSYIIPAAVIKSGRVVTIDAKGIAATDKMSAPTIPGRFPNWAGVIPTAADAGRVSLTADQWKQLKKAVADVAKVHPSDKYTMRRVTIAHESYSNKLIVYAFNYDFSRERETVINDIATDAPAFSISFKSDDFKRIGGNVSALYVKDNARAIVTTDAAGLSLVMPVLQLDDDKYYINFNIDTDAAPVELLPGLDIAAAAADIKKENKRATAAEFIKEYNDEHADEEINADTMADTFAQRYRYTFDDANEARRVLADVLSETTANESETTAAPAADQTTDADTMSDRENEHNDNESAPALTLPPLAALLTSNDAPTLSLTLPTPSPRPVLLLPVLTSEESTNETPAAVPDQMTAAPAADITTDESAADVLPLVAIDDENGVILWARPDIDTTADTITDESDQESTDAPAVVIAANFAHRARRWFQVAAAVLAVLIITAAPVAITTNESDTAAPAADQMTANETRAAVLAIYEAVSDGTSAAPAADQMTAADTVSAREIKRETPRPRRHHHRATVAAPVAIVADTLTAETLGAPVAIVADTLTAPALVVDTLQGARNITETADTLSADTLETARDITAAPAADVESTTANDDTQTAATAADIETSDTAAPSIESTTANDDTANDGAPATTGTTTTTTPAPAAGSPAAVATPCPPAAPVAPVAPIIL